MKKILAAAALLFALTPAQAAFDPDPTFTPEPLSGLCQPVLAVLGDGASYTSFYDETTQRPSVARFLVSGQLDRGWGNGGKAALPRNPYTDVQTSAHGFLPLPDGGLLVIDSHVVRYTREGTLDTTFGRGGVSVRIVDDVYEPGIKSFALQSDGKVVIASDASQVAPGLLFTRIDGGGNRDTSFGANGLLRVPLETPGLDVYAWSVRADGAIVIGTVEANTVDVPHPRLRALPESAVVPGGPLLPRQGLATWLSPRVSVLADGAVLFATTTRRANEPFAQVTRFDPSGEVDRSYGNAGTVLLSPFAGDSPLGISNQQVEPRETWLGSGGSVSILLRGGRVFGGFAGISNVGDWVYRLRADGSLDPDFVNGARLTDSAFSGVARLGDGRVMLAGFSWDQCAKRLTADAPKAEGRVIEYYHPALDHYFITLEGMESGILDNSAAMGWRRTGQTFGAWGAVDIQGAARVCRFYGDLSAGPNSHFYSPEGAECAALRQRESQSVTGTRAWRFEGLTFGSAPAAAGGCGPNLTPVFRLYNRGFEEGVDPNHRYTTDSGVYAGMQQQGWVGEGVAFCVPPATGSAAFP